jgi:hypothetical protein
MLASAKWENDIVKVLLKYWANINAKNNEWQKAIDFAKDCNNYDIVNILKN